MKLKYSIFSHINEKIKVRKKQNIIIKSIKMQAMGKNFKQLCIEPFSH